MKHVDYQTRMQLVTDNARRDAVALTVLCAVVMVIFITLAVTAYNVEPLAISLPLIFVLGMAQGAFMIHVVSQWKEYRRMREWTNKQKEDQ